MPEPMSFVVKVAMNAGQKMLRVISMSQFLIDVSLCRQLQLLSSFLHRLNKVTLGRDYEKGMGISKGKATATTLWCAASNTKCVN